VVTAAKSDAHAAGDGRASYDGPIRVAQRYEVLRPLGRGGMALVYEVRDVVSGRKIALKRLLVQADEQKARRATELFEREYHTLCQLAHPRIVTVYDYALDDGTPYYTMELLDGGDLQDVAPVGFLRACAFARDLCSALSLLHSRRLVHRDLTMRNVRCTGDGLAKLIDFGAMAVMGPCKYVVGTPSYCAPEIVQLQGLDARTDLFALGATLYYALTGRHAYPASDFAGLLARWQVPLRPPSELAPGVPDALDRLLLDLLALDPAARPSSAAEVIARLDAITGSGGQDDEREQAPVVAQSYLTTPALVGRDLPLARARGKLQRAARGRGSALLIEGASGVGRTRLLAACLLEAKLLGMTAVRTDADDAREGDYGCVRALARQLLEALPEHAASAAQAHLPVLGHLLPELLASTAGVVLQPFDDGERLRPALQAALRDWLLAIGRDRSLLLAIDDVHAIDEPSAALIALLAHDLRKHALAVIATREPSALVHAPAPLALLEAASSRLALGNLSPEHGELLLRSVFGDAPQLGVLAHRLHALAAGNPRDLMRLAQHLLDRGLVSYRGGAWSLPAAIDADDLPVSIAHALAERLARLGGAARELAGALALAPELSVTFEECSILSELGSALAHAALDELLHADVVRASGERYVLAQGGWAPLLRAGLDPELERTLARRLALLFEQRPDERFRMAQQLLRAGEDARALDVLFEHVQVTTQQTELRPEAFSALVRALPADWQRTFERAITLSHDHGRKRADVYALLGRYAGIVAMMGAPVPQHVADLLQSLARDAGLDLWPGLDPALGSVPRIARALELAKARNDQLPEEQRGLDPIDALRLLGRMLIQAGGSISTSLDVPLLEALPTLGPYAAISPALGVTETLLAAIRARLTAQLPRSKQLYADVLERTAQPDRGGIGASHFTYLRLGTMYAIGMLDAALGLRSSLEWADQIEAEPLHRVNALYLRMLYRLSQADVTGAENDMREVELLRIQNSPRQWFEGTYLFWRLHAFSALDDLTRVKQSAEQIAELAALHRGWVPVWRFAQGEYHRIRGDFGQALAAYAAAHAVIPDGGHQIWPLLAGAELRVSYEDARFEHALERGHALLERAERQDLGYGVSHLLMPLSLIEARLGLHEQAVLHAERVIELFETLGATGIPLLLAHETRARVALLLRDQAGFDRSAARCAEVVRSATSTALVAKYERLRQDARRAEVAVNVEEPLPDGEAQQRFSTTRVNTLFSACTDPDARAHCALSLLAAASSSDGGFLFMSTRSGPIEVARLGNHTLGAGIGQQVADFVRDARDSEERATSIGPEIAPVAAEWTGEHGEHYCPVLLSHDAGGGFVITGVALLRLTANTTFQYPASTAAELSRLLHEAGDVELPTMG
jgi:tetratricopeptide (TPR) repeat protein